MSKSCSSPKGKIEITDSSDAIFHKIKKSLTDCKSAVTFDPAERPGVSNLVAMHSALTKRTPTQICYDARNLDTGQYVLAMDYAMDRYLFLFNPHFSISNSVTDIVGKKKQNSYMS